MCKFLRTSDFVRSEFVSEKESVSGRGTGRAGRCVREGEGRERKSERAREGGRERETRGERKREREKERETDRESFTPRKLAVSHGARTNGSRAEK